MLNEKEKVFRDNCGDDFFFILLLSFFIAIFVSRLSINVTRAITNLNAVELSSIDFIIYISTAIFVITFYYVEKFEVFKT